MTNLKIAALVALVTFLAFGFGWTARGDAIYSDMFNQRAAVMEKLK